jgi:hypothetical protein
MEQTVLVMKWRVAIVLAGRRSGPNVQAADSMPIFKHRAVHNKSTAHLDGPHARLPLICRKISGQ